MDKFLKKVIQRADDIPSTSGVAKKVIKRRYSAEYSGYGFTCCGNK